jgi:hypothetical protein
MTMTAWPLVILVLALPVAAALVMLWALGEDTTEVDDPDSPWGSC